MNVMQTNHEIREESPLNVAADALLVSAMEYWQAHRNATGGSAIVWVEATDGKLVLMTRGEYADTLLRNVDRLRSESRQLVPYEPFNDDVSLTAKAGREIGVDVFEDIEQINGELFENFVIYRHGQCAVEYSYEQPDRDEKSYRFPDGRRETGYRDLTADELESIANKMLDVVAAMRGDAS